MPVYGARTDIDRPVPNGALYIADAAHGGHLSGDGSAARPLAVWADAFHQVPDRGTIVARGEFVATLTPPPGKQFTIMSPGGERAAIMGRVPVTAWSKVGAGLWRTDWTDVIPHDVSHAPQIVDPAHPWAPYPLQVWVDLQALDRVGSLAETQGEWAFCHDEPNGHLYIGVDPGSGEVTVSKLERGFIGAQAPNSQVNIDGLTFDGFATRPAWLAAVIIHSDDTSVQDVEIARCSAAGLFVNQVDRVTLDHLTLWENGQLGGSAYQAEDLEIGYCSIGMNNYRRFVTGQKAGAFKADTYCHRAQVHHNQLIANVGHGFWFDLWCEGLNGWRNVGYDGTSLFYVELARDVCLTGNIAQDMDNGNLASGCEKVERSNNTYVDCDNDNRTQTDSRLEEHGWVHNGYLSYNEMHVRTLVNRDAAATTWHDTHGGNQRTVDNVNLVSDNGRYHRTDLSCGSVVRATMGMGVLRNFAHLVDAAAQTGLERAGLESVGPDNPFMDDDLRAIGQAKNAGIPMTARTRTLLDLDRNEAISPDVGWYGPEVTTTEPPEDPDMPTYDTAPLTEADFALGVAIQEIILEVRRLEGMVDVRDTLITDQENEINRLQALIDGDDHLATIADLTEQLRVQSIAYYNTALLVGELRRTVTTLNSTVVGLQQQVNGLLSQVNTLTASLEEQEELNGEVTAERDQARADLAACQAEHQDTGPELDPIIVGGSHQQGWPALKTMLGEAPDAYRQFVGGARMGASAINVTLTVQNDGAIPYVSVTKPLNIATAPDDAQWNCDQWINAGAADRAGVIIPIHEPTQKISGADFKQVLAAAMPIYRDRLPNWKRLICFMRADFLVPESDPRHPIHYLPDDLTLIDGIGVDLYDKGNASADGNGMPFADLMEPVEAFADANNLVIHVLECSAPDQGQRPGNPPVSNPRRKNWKSDFTYDAWAHMTDPTMYLSDGRRMYGTFLTFNSTEGGDSPAAVPANPTATPPQPYVPAGWRADTTPESLATFKNVLAASREL